jgi:hypothetical protein
MRKHRERLWDAGLALFILAAAAALVLYLGVHDPARDVVAAEETAAEERAVRAVQRLKGKIVRAETAPGKPVVAVDLSSTPVTDAGLKELAVLKQLRTLSLRGTPVTDAGLKELAGLHRLDELDLTNSQVTGAGLKELAGLKQLRILSLGRMQLSFVDTKFEPGQPLQVRIEAEAQRQEAIRAALAHLAQMQQLKALHVTMSDGRRENLGALNRLKGQLKDWLQKALPRCSVTVD